MTPKQAKKKAEAAVAKWTHPVGTRVKVRRDNGDTLETVTRSVAWVMCDSAVVMVDGISGCYALERVTPCL